MIVCDPLLGDFRCKPNVRIGPHSTRRRLTSELVEEVEHEHQAIRAVVGCPQIDGDTLAVRMQIELRL